MHLNEPTGPSSCHYTVCAVTGYQGISDA